MRCEYPGEIRIGPPSSSGLGRRPFTAVARVRIPLGVHATTTAVGVAQSKALWRSWLARRPVTAEVAGSSPVRVATTARHTDAFRPGSSVGTSVRLKSGRSPVRSRPWPPRSQRRYCSYANQGSTRADWPAWHDRCYKQMSAERVMFRAVAAWGKPRNAKFRRTCRVYPACKCRHCAKAAVSEAGQFS